MQILKAKAIATTSLYICQIVVQLCYKSNADEGFLDSLCVVHKENKSSKTKPLFTAVSGVINFKMFFKSKRKCHKTV